MGNHEYCEECGANDFHMGRPCDPERLAKKKSEQAARNIVKDKAIKKLEALELQLEKQGIIVGWDYSFDGEPNGLVINWWDN